MLVCAKTAAFISWFSHDTNSCLALFTKLCSMISLQFKIDHFAKSDRDRQIGYESIITILGQFHFLFIIRVLAWIMTDKGKPDLF